MRKPSYPGYFCVCGGRSVVVTAGSVSNGMVVFLLPRVRSLWLCPTPERRRTRIRRSTPPTEFVHTGRASGRAERLERMALVATLYTPADLRSMVWRPLRLTATASLRTMHATGGSRPKEKK